MRRAIIAACLLAGLAAATRAEGREPSGCSSSGLGQLKGYPGDTVEMYGSWRECASGMTPTLSYGRFNYILEVVGWGDTSLSVRIPPGLEAGEYGLGLHCAQWKKDCEVGGGRFEVLPEGLRPAGEAARGLRAQAREAWFAGDAAGAEDLALQAYKAYEQAQDDHGMAWSLYLRAYALEALGRDGEADQARAVSYAAFQRAIESLSRRHRGSEVKNQRNALDEAFAATHDPYYRAKKTEAWPARRLIEQDLFNLLCGMGQSAVRRMDIAEAARLAEESLALAEWLGDDRLAAVAYFEKGTACERSGDRDGAAKAFNSAARHEAKWAAANRGRPPERPARLPPDPAPASMLSPRAERWPAISLSEDPKLAVAQLRLALVHYIEDHGAKAPEHLADLAKEGYIQAAPRLKLPEHKETDAEVAVGLGDTGLWVYSPDAYQSSVRIDCSHTDALGTRWRDR